MAKGLGKGLDALLPNLLVNQGEEIIEVELSLLKPNIFQPRKIFNQEQLDELVQSIKEHGVIQPIIIRKTLKGYEIIAGERRFRAAKIVGLTTIPAVVRDYSDDQVMEIALIENLQREDLNPVEVASAYQKIMDRFHLTQEELANKVGKSRPHVANFLRLLNLPQEILDEVSRGTITMGHARAILAIEDEELQKELLTKIKQEEWNVRQIEEYVQNLKTNEKDKNKKKPKKNSGKKDIYIKEYENLIRERLNTIVRIKGAQNKGRIEIKYNNKDELERIIDLFLADHLKMGE